MTIHLCLLLLLVPLAAAQTTCGSTVIAPGSPASNGLLMLKGSIRPGKVDTLSVSTASPLQIYLGYNCRPSPRNHVALGCGSVSHALTGDFAVPGVWYIGLTGCGNATLDDSVEVVGSVATGSCMQGLFDWQVLSDSQIETSLSCVKEESTAAVRSLGSMLPFVVTILLLTV